MTVAARERFFRAHFPGILTCLYFAAVLICIIQATDAAAQIGDSWFQVIYALTLPSSLPVVALFGLALQPAPALLLFCAVANSALIFCVCVGFKKL
ncbi:MAG TPA: hypothetical protein VE713_07470 [Pyrinomonadaceae bacterium]|jgi:hypothetical protein|nr:hypothetical protein [Pyrinomonadaceae bacterium]